MNRNVEQKTKDPQPSCSAMPKKIQPNIKEKENTKHGTVLAALRKNVNLNISESQRAAFSDIKLNAEVRDPNKAEQQKAKTEQWLPAQQIEPKQKLKSVNFQVPDRKKELRGRAKSFNPDLKFVTVRNSLAVAVPKKKSASVSDEIFISGEKHHDFIKLKQQESLDTESIVPVIEGVISPIKPNIYTPVTTLISQGTLKTPAKKKTLKANNDRKKKYDSIPTFDADFYVSDYLEDIISYLLENEDRYLLKKQFLRTYDVNSSNRACVINWLLKLTVQINISTIIYLMTIKLFDVVLNSIEIPKNMYQLVIHTALRIVQKDQESVRKIRVKDMISYCNNAYSKQQILYMENKLLKFFYFNCKLPESTPFISYYLEKLNTKDEALVTCASYILECYTLSEDYSTELPSLLAATAVYIALEVVYKKTDNWIMLKQHSAYYEVEKLKQLRENMRKQLFLIGQCDYEHREVFYKYSLIENFQVLYLQLLEVIL